MICFKDTKIIEESREILLIHVSLSCDVLSRMPCDYIVQNSLLVFSKNIGRLGVGRRRKKKRKGKEKVAILRVFVREISH
jgi:hypothetical protein